MNMNAKDKIRQANPAAYSFRFEGKCPKCEHFALVSYRVLGMGAQDYGVDECAFYCHHCEWTDTGTRPSQGMSHD